MSGTRSDGRSAAISSVGRYAGPATLGGSGALLLFFSPFLIWVNPLLQGPIEGYRIPIFGSASILSFGGLGFLLGLIGLSSFFLKVPWLTLLSGGMALLSAVTFLGQIALSDPAWLRMLVEQNRQYQEIVRFTATYLPLNRGVEPLFSPGLTIDRVADRLVTSGDFLSWGWYFSVVGGSLLIIGWFFGRPPRRRGILVLFLVFFTLYLNYLFVPSIVAEYWRIQGDRHLIQGLYANALSDYLKAGEYDQGLGSNTRYRLNMGAVYGGLGRKDQADYHLYQGSMLENKGKKIEAAFEYDRAKTIGPEGAAYVAENHLGWLFISDGLQAYKRGALGAAIMAWKKAARIDPDQLQAHYYLARAFFEIGQYEEAIQENRIFLGRSLNTMLNANAYANLGDCYNKLQNYQKAREFYLRSLSLDNDQNYRALISLVGP